MVNILLRLALLITAGSSVSAFALDAYEFGTRTKSFYVEKKWNQFFGAMTYYRTHIKEIGIIPQIIQLEILAYGERCRLDEIESAVKFYPPKETEEAATMARYASTLRNRDAQIEKSSSPRALDESVRWWKINSETLAKVKNPWILRREVRDNCDSPSDLSVEEVFPLSAAKLEADLPTYRSTLKEEALFHLTFVPAHLLKETPAVYAQELLKKKNDLQVQDVVHLNQVIADEAMIEGDLGIAKTHYTRMIQDTDPGTQDHAYAIFKLGEAFEKSNSPQDSIQLWTESYKKTEHSHLREEIQQKLEQSWVKALQSSKNLDQFFSAWMKNSCQQEFAPKVLTNVFQKSASLQNKPCQALFWIESCEKLGASLQSAIVTKCYQSLAARGGQPEDWKSLYRYLKSPEEKARASYSAKDFDHACKDFSEVRPVSLNSLNGLVFSCSKANSFDDKAVLEVIRLAQGDSNLKYSAPLLAAVTTAKFETVFKESFQELFPDKADLLPAELRKIAAKKVIVALESSEFGSAEELLKKYFPLEDTISREGVRLWGQLVLASESARSSRIYEDILRYYESKGVQSSEDRSLVAWVLSQLPEEERVFFIFQHWNYYAKIVFHKESEKEAFLLGILNNTQITDSATNLPPQLKALLQLKNEFLSEPTDESARATLISRIRSPSTLESLGEFAAIVKSDFSHSLALLVEPKILQTKKLDSVDKDFALIQRQLSAFNRYSFKLPWFRDWIRRELKSRVDRFAEILKLQGGDWVALGEAVGSWEVL